MKKLDFYILFLFAAQIFIYFTKSSASAYTVPDMVGAGAKNGFLSSAFVFYFLSFCILFLNMFNLFLAYKSGEEVKKGIYVLIAMLGTILFFLLSFTSEILVFIGNSKL